MFANCLQIFCSPAIKSTFFMATTNAVLDQRRARKDGSFPIKIQVIHDRKTFMFPLKIFLQKEYWNEGLRRVNPDHPDSNRFNQTIIQEELRIQRLIYDLELQQENYSIADIKCVVQGKKKVAEDCLLCFGYQQVEQMTAAGRFGNAHAYKYALLKLQRYHPKEELPIKSFTYSYLEQFEAALLADGIRKNAIASYMRSLRAIYNKAIKARLVDRSHYPFADYTIKTERTISRTLTKAEIKKIEHLELPDGSAIRKYRDLFMLSFNLIGISYIDMAFLRFENWEGDRIWYKRKKTGKIYNIKLTPQAAEILNNMSKVKDKSQNQFLLPIIPDHLMKIEEQRKSAQQGYRHCNKYLKKIADQCGIDKPITTYWARYSWANIARSLGYSKDLIAEALGHEYGNRVTGIYLDNYNNALIDEANARVTAD
jgi:integrase/recombinase XerD